MSIPAESSFVATRPRTLLSTRHGFKKSASPRDAGSGADKQSRVGGCARPRETHSRKSGAFFARQNGSGTIKYLFNAQVSIPWPHARPSDLTEHDDDHRTGTGW